ncbi:isoafricanol synthase [Streptomyces sp. H10-C2]|uniref:isoafricanol synthase n=1 Tax=unclassified Streptomyces TaxID=2593676 RepID=UPI0024BBA67E|nr:MULTISPECIES: isoafricanol synthase [unclassified Streptomyces]MDJ0344173.1 isoafricanol synthase [Streptomyces sp. PH10-H1]MDJ0373068.1 isoafricanol synthase [Streptomyces sp. H10-C2]
MTDSTAPSSAIPRDILAERTTLLSIPFPGRSSPHADRARRHTLQWLRDLRILRADYGVSEYDALRLERLMAFFYPRATGPDLDLAADFNAWFFIFDDQFDGPLGRRPDDVEREVDALVSILYEPPSPSSPPVNHPPVGHQASPLADGFRDIWVRSAAGTPAVWQERFRDHWREYLRAYHWEALNRTQRPPLTLDAFLRGRRDSIGVQPCLDFAERCGGYTLPEMLHSTSPLAEMREITGDVVIFVNDIMSVDKEMAAGDVNNSVILLRNTTDHTLEEAVGLIARAANARVQRFQTLAERLPAVLDEYDAAPDLLEQVDDYVRAMRHVMRGNLDWSLETARYRESGIAAVSGGRQRPWSDLFGPDGTNGITRGGLG